LSVHDITKGTSRKRLLARREPYWLKLATGAYLGFRRGPDTWIARWRRPGSRTQHYQALEGVESFDDAKRAAERWLATMTSVATRAPKKATVKAALESYLAYLGEQGRESTAADAEKRFKLTVYDDAIASIRVDKLTMDDFREWRDRLRKGRTNRSVNRQVRAVTAGLNMAIRRGFIANRSAWDIEPLADDVEQEGNTAVFLNAAQREALISRATPELALFLRGLEVTGARPSELASARVCDYDGETVRLASRKGRSSRLRVRRTVISSGARALFDRLVANRAASDLLFSPGQGEPWMRHQWSRAITAAVKAHNSAVGGKARIPVGASAYSFRHARISELLQIHGIDPLTVAAQTGTSVAMIERAYFRFIPSAMREKLEAVR
jgi:integrase